MPTVPAFRKAGKGKIFRAFAFLRMVGFGLVHSVRVRSAFRIPVEFGIAYPFATLRTLEKCV